MLHPSYTDLMKVVNSNVEQGEAPVVNSRYSIVAACIDNNHICFIFIVRYCIAFLHQQYCPKSYRGY